MTIPKKNITLKLSIRYGYIKVLADGEVITSCEFCIEDTQIRATDLNTEDEYQRKGYGRTCLDALKILATQLKMPIILYSLVDAIPFYESLGFEHLNDKKVQAKVKFGNIKTKKDMKEKGPTDGDMIWVPKSLNKKKPVIYM